MSRSRRLKGSVILSFKAAMKQGEVAWFKKFIPRSSGSNLGFQVWRAVLPMNLLLFLFLLPFLDCQVQGPNARIVRGNLCTPPPSCSSRSLAVSGVQGTARPASAGQPV
jgi:hypothetical protein